MTLTLKSEDVVEDVEIVSGLDSLTKKGRWGGGDKKCQLWHPVPQSCRRESRDLSLWPEGEVMFPPADHLEYCNQNGFVKGDFNSKVFFFPTQNEHIKSGVVEKPTNTQTDAQYGSRKPGGGKRRNTGTKQEQNCGKNILLCPTESPSSHQA